MAIGYRWLSIGHVPKLASALPANGNPGWQLLWHQQRQWQAKTRQKIQYGGNGLKWLCLWLWSEIRQRKWRPKVQRRNMTQNSEKYLKKCWSEMTIGPLKLAASWNNEAGWYWLMATWYNQLKAWRRKCRRQWQWRKYGVEKREGAISAWRQSKAAWQRRNNGGIISASCTLSKWKGWNRRDHLKYGSKEWKAKWKGSGW